MYTGKETKLGKEGRKEGWGNRAAYEISSRLLSQTLSILSFSHFIIGFHSQLVRLKYQPLYYHIHRHACLKQTNKQKTNKKREKELTDEFKRLPGILTPTDPHGRHFFHPPFRTVSLGASFHITWAGFPFFSDIHVLLVCFLPSIHSLSLSLCPSSCVNILDPNKRIKSIKK